MSDEKTEEIKSSSDSNETNQVKKNPIVLLSRIIVIVAVLFFIWYVFSDRITPYTDQARITELVIPITPRVSGYLTNSNVKLHSEVGLDQVLFEIDTTPFVLAVHKASANLDNVAQQMGAQSASVTAAESSVGVAKAQLDRAQRNYNRTKNVMKKNPGAISQADLDRVETSLNQSVEKLASAEANYEKAKKQLGEVGPNILQF